MHPACDSPISIVSNFFRLFTSYVASIRVGSFQCGVEQLSVRVVVLSVLSVLSSAPPDAAKNYHGQVERKEGATAQLEKFKPIPAKLLATWAWQQADNPNITWQFELIALECPAGLPSNAKLAGAFANCRSFLVYPTLFFPWKPWRLLVVWFLHSSPGTQIWCSEKNQTTKALYVYDVYTFWNVTVCVYIYIIYLLYKFIRFLCILPLSFGLEECRISGVELVWVFAMGLDQMVFGWEIAWIW